MKLGAAGLIGLALVMTTAPSRAQSLDDAYGFDAGIISEVRAGISAHAVTTAFLPWNGTYDFGNVSDLTFDVLFTSPGIDAFTWLGAPRPELGATINFNGEESLVHGGLVWQLPLFDTPIYLEGALGAAVHNGYLDDAPPGERNHGCQVNFYERVGLGANLSENVTATLTYEHMSNADLCEFNNGLTNVGLRLGWKF